MSSKVAISVDNISKKFRLFNSHGERVLEALHPFKKKYHREFWALRDVSFDVQKGSTVGIVGRNGSGKSTLLQIICSVLRPTDGSAVVDGKVASLLELGAGFNPELTGRENVYLKCTIMGLPKPEIRERFPRIEEFADIGEFMEQPVRTYSSGMFVRLAFAAAINVDPDVLVIDEALAVGDARFQHKCYNKFRDFQNAGKTILFVSHSMDAIVNHCDYAIMLEGGRLLEKGSPKIITDYYLDLLLTDKVTGYTHTPVLVEEGYKGFNIVHFGMKHYAFAHSLGQFDIDSLGERKLEGLLDERTCLVGLSLDDLRKMIDRVTSQEPTDQAGIVGRAKTALEKFLEDRSSEGCENRNSYNKNEHRFGNMKGEIIDYLLVARDKHDPVSVVSGETVDIFMKVKYFQDVESPLYGFAIKALDGVLIYGSNTRYEKTPVASVKEGDVIVFKFTIELDVQPGDIFLDLGVAEKDPVEDKHIDVRVGVVHINVQPSDRFTGLARLKTVCEEIGVIDREPVPSA